MVQQNNDAANAAGQWLTAFEAALTRREPEAAAELFLPDGQWRDILAFTWNIQSVFGRSGIEALLGGTLERTRPIHFRIDPKRTPPRWVTRAGTKSLEAFLVFDTVFGRGNGVLRLVPGAPAPAHLRAWTLSTSLQELRGFEERIGALRSMGPSDLRDFGSENWLDLRRKAAAYDNRDPAVLVIGAGQAGLSIAARLGALGVDTLVVDRNARIGDNWRNRYHSLTLHNEVVVNDLPYLPFPPSFPTYISKDKLASWLEFYADAMELNCWTSTEFVSGEYDEKAERWTVKLQRADGTRRSMRPRHVVLAVGASPISHIPKLQGIESFAGTLMHSEAYTTGTSWRGRKALVLGSGTSGHDVAQDLTACGAQVTMIQRGPTYVVSLREAQRVYKTYTEGIPVEECDLLGISYPYQALLRAYQTATAEATCNDRKLLGDLTAAGFRLDLREGDTGFQPRYFERGGGYYFNVGCSNLIIDGKVGLIQYSDVERFVPEGVLMRDGNSVPADLLVLATGYLSQQDVVRRLLGDEVADRVGPVWGLGADGELRNMWTRTPQKGLWIHAGSLPQCRIFSRFLALQIKACEEGLISPEMPTRIGAASSATPIVVEQRRRRESRTA
jgi:cation diffusion facilitator CzcD-associated flavoprotein CzcO